MHTNLKVAFNTGIQIFGRFFNGIITFLVTLMLVRTYGPVEFGDFIKILTYISYFYIMADFGANALTVKKMTAEANNSFLYLSELMGFRILASLILIFISLTILVFVPQGINQGFTPAVRLGIVFGSVTILTQSLLTTANAFFQKNLRYDKSVMAAGVGYGVTLLLAYIFTRMAIPVSLLSLIYVFGQTISVVIAFIFIGQSIVPSFDTKAIKNIFFSSLPLGLTLILNLIYFKSDSFILALTRPTVEVGVYGLAYKFFELTLVLPTFFMNSLYPVMLLNLNAGRENFNQLMKKSGILLILSSLAITGLLFWFSPFLINLTAGVKYSDFNGAVLALRILSLGLPFFFLSSFLMWMLITKNRQNLMAMFYGISMLFNIVLNIIFIPKYGYLSAAVITVISELLVTVLLLIPNLDSKNKFV